MRPTEPTHAEVARTLASLGRDTRGRVLAMLARRFGDLDLAEDVTQEAYARALEAWQRTGIPESPEAWLKTTATRAALDQVRREASLARKLAELRVQEERAPALPAEAGVDDRLDLLFACAHPALSSPDRIALTLRFVAGLTTPEVSRALLVPVPTLQQRIVRAKKRIRTLGIPLTVPEPEEVPARLQAVLQVVYLVFAEGYARLGGHRHVGDELTTEAVRLARLLHGLYPTAETTGLTALLVLHQARRGGRLDAQGRPVPLKEQDRGLWSRDLLAEGIELAERSAQGADADVYAIQACIAAVHAEAASFAETDWAQIAVLYRMLEARDASPLVRLGRAVAVGRWQGPEVGLRQIDALGEDPVLTGLRAFHTARAVTLTELGRDEEAVEAYRVAAGLPGNDAETGLITASIESLG